MSAAFYIYILYFRLFGDVLIHFDLASLPHYSTVLQIIFLMTKNVFFFTFITTLSSSRMCVTGGFKHHKPI